MKYLYLMGGSGCGKTMLAMHLEEYDKNIYHRVLELTTRTKRPEEKEDWDYRFVSDDEFDKLKQNCFETVENQFLPKRYGAEIKELDSKKWNVIVASIEGFLSAVKKSEEDVVHLLINIINDCELDVARDGRDPLMEEHFNKACLMPFKINTTNFLCINNRYIKYVELPLSKLKEIRDDREATLKYFNSIIN